MAVTANRPLVVNRMEVSPEWVAAERPWGRRASRYPTDAVKYN